MTHSKSVLSVSTGSSLAWNLFLFCSLDNISQALRTLLVKKNVIYDLSSYSSTFARFTFEAPLSHEIETKDCSSCLARIICSACYLSSWHVEARQLEQSLVSISALRCSSSYHRNGRIFYYKFLTDISLHLYGASFI